jgi:hypothetical protein
MERILDGIKRVRATSTIKSIVLQKKIVICSFILHFVVLNYF